MKFQRTPNSQDDLELEEQSQDTQLPDFKTHYKAEAMERMWYCQKDRCTDQWVRIESRDKPSTRVPKPLLW